MANYGAENIKVLKGLEAVRKRPGMYIGDTGVKGLHHLIYEVVDNSIDEAMAGYANKIKVTVKKDGSVVIEDNGRGIPVDIHPEEKIPAATVVLTVLHAGGKFDNKTYKVSGGLHGVGVSVVNALSKKLIMTIKRDGKIYRQEFERGKPVTDLEVIGETRATGTTIQFWPDDEIFETTEFKSDILRKRLKELAYLNPNITIYFENENDGVKEKYHFEGGIKDFVKTLTNKECITEVIYYNEHYSDEEKSLDVEVALCYDTGYDEKVLSFVNNIRTPEGGTHESGFKAGLSKAIINYINKNMKLKENIKITGDDVKEGLDAIVSVKMSEPQFEGQTKGKLGSSYVKPIVQKVTYEYLTRYFEENPNTAKTIAEKAIAAAKSRIAAKRARDLTRKQAKVGVGTLPGKLADCQTKNADEAELYLVEGDSAGGSAKQGRDRYFQAILPLRGKILNTQKSSDAKALSSEEIKNIITALGTGIGADFDADKVRYKKIIIMTDADVDGSHIQTLIMTFFFNHLRELIERGYLYIAQPPLYRYKKGKVEKYLKDDKELNEFLIEQGINSIEIEGVGKPELKELLKNAAYYKLLLEKLTKRFNIPEVIRFLIENGNLDELEEHLKKFGFSIISKHDNHYYIQTNRGLEEITIDEKLLNHPLFLEAKKVYEKLKEYKDLVKGDYLELLDEVINKARKGAHIQRYKGLGEMNPDQLWDTTMDPENRVLIQVTLEDAENAAKHFELFMGSDVGPRREYIQANAKEVENIDV
ncbi:DNA topoisomerase (ATP-hydrolyzing) subunit B [Caminibacter pacificus]|jgi:DNA gyrase subunit B|uniref:DNA gyrase subunit B n=1 Tax=Caminibacter pacificus TaxID=1424653 RepID=A0AAJ4UX92_9BACT|nr:DNA topoisomerase (ATP-hydrolyzing) subunit B [Caminibacter pacificus]NPA87985.1 DNA topoisomerase (ATP-hydrolyzing) subunit B [Campylobacterota bacterium]QCI27405.1 DNA topoisomerase (ATP-hydrolyzing) subunit B [Caminibacter pacificus]ROR38842.1 DNA gyrase subunit B [Caminibacter pacificus]